MSSTLGSGDRGGAERCISERHRLGMVVIESSIVGEEAARGRRGGTRSSGRRRRGISSRT